MAAACAAACALAGASPAWSQGSALRLQADPTAPDATLPVTIEADRIDSTLGGTSTATGNVTVVRGGLKVRADSLVYRQAQERVEARGEVRVERGGDRFEGTELTLDLDNETGQMLSPTYWFARTQAGGQAHRIELLDRSRSRLFKATYSSCPADGSGDPDWLLTTDRVAIDIDRNEGIAEGAVLRFLGVPILGLPVLSFPVTDERKSGWLPPSLTLDSRAGIEVSAPYYWNIAPDMDATLTPIVSTRRGVGGVGELRWLAASDEGRVNLHGLPDDRVAGRSRGSINFAHRGVWGPDLRYSAAWERASDDAYWKDFTRYLPSLTPRLLPLDLRADYRLAGAEDTPLEPVSLYARVQRWQVLRDTEEGAAIVSPYQRSPQVGVRGSGTGRFGITWRAETEFNRFDLPAAGGGGWAGDRVHLLGAVERRFGEAGWWVTPRAALNAASYDTPTLRASRAIPTLSLDAGALFERDTRLFDRALRQTLEPRLLFVSTPYRDQTALPRFDAEAKDLNLVSIFSENVFSGIDRVSDARQVTAGATSRLLDADDGRELLRLGVAQRYLFADQRVTPDNVVLSQRISDVLVGGSSRVWASWVLDGTLQYSPELSRTTRTVLSARYSPGPFRTIGATYRLSRNLSDQADPGRIQSEQIDVGWQWPVWRGAARASAGGCAGTMYAVGRLNYSLLDSRIVDSLAGVEYDAGCWILRVVAQRQSTGRSEANNSLLLQLELVGLSRLGSNPLQVLKDNIPGYRLLRDDDALPAPTAAPPTP